MKISKWTGFSDAELINLKSHINRSGTGIVWADQIHEELVQRPARMERAEKLAKEFDAVAQKALDAL